MIRTNRHGSIDFPCVSDHVSYFLYASEKPRLPNKDMLLLILLMQAQKYSITEKSDPMKCELQTIMQIIHQIRLKYILYSRNYVP